METAVVAIIAVIGTLLGSSLTYLFQRQVNEHQSALDIAERARQERLDACAAFGGAGVRFRVAALDLWHRNHEPSSEEARSFAKADYYRLRTEAVDAETRVHLVSPSASLNLLMSDVIETASRIPDATDASDRRDRNTAAKEALSRFIGAASDELHRRRAA
jgi:hypothetical protein